VDSLLTDGEYTHWTSQDDDPIDNHFVFDFGERRKPVRIEWSDWGREDGAGHMRLAVSDEVHAGWTRVCGFSTRQTSDWQFHDVEPENQCIGRFLKVTIKRAHRPGFGLQLRGLRLYASAKPAPSNSQHVLHSTLVPKGVPKGVEYAFAKSTHSAAKHVESPQVHKAVHHDHIRLPISSKKPPSRVCDGVNVAYDGGTEWNWIELVKELRAENAKLTARLEDLQREKDSKAQHINHDMYLNAKNRVIVLEEQLQEEENKTRVIVLEAQLQEETNKARALGAEREVLDLQRRLMDLTGETAACDFNELRIKLEGERDEAVRAREHLEQTLAQVLNMNGWYTAPVDKCKSTGGIAPEPSPLPSTQASTQVSPEPSPPSSPRLAELAHWYDNRVTALHGTRK